MKIGKFRPQLSSKNCDISWDFLKPFFLKSSLLIHCQNHVFLDFLQFRVLLKIFDLSKNGFLSVNLQDYPPNFFVIGFDWKFDLNTQKLKKFTAKNLTFSSRFPTNCQASPKKRTLTSIILKLEYKG